jgi:hypothetical protein
MSSTKTITMFGFSLPAADRAHNEQSDRMDARQVRPTEVVEN